MTLSLDDVRNKRFRMARKGGYEVLEVDEFVDEVEESFAQLFEENANLKKQVDALKSSSGDQAPTQAAETSTPTEAPAAVEADQPVAAQQSTQQSTQPTAQQAPSAPTRDAEHIVVTTSAEASSAVVRLVQLSTEQAEHLVREANEEASRIRDDANRNAQQVTEDARTRADRVESEARVNAERVQTEAQNRSESLERELSERRTQLFGDLDRERASLTDTVARLRDFEQRYRSNLGDHLRGQLESLDHLGLEPEGGPERTAPREGGDAAPQGQDETSVRPAEPDAHAKQDDGSSSDNGQSSATPRLDALLGEQR
ncbi:DivIVA domain-containing protein [Microlunatus flavus]|uniref:Cell wall synthesis protein Wag31 n=1 Tax=Microlunatus flavus TaxID=1036181 RepID=A0A1H9HEM0_9ACTN|nr:DivIVA domain-containing protein [Microlunatus flavus]SEQ60791.1 DivIVA domain-containing protein [Microlunatus flavus]